MILWKNLLPSSCRRSACDRMLHVRRASSYGMLPKMIWRARRWTSSSCFVCSFVRLACQHGRIAYSRTGRFGNGSDRPHRRRVTPLLRAIGRDRRARRLEAAAGVYGGGVPGIHMSSQMTVHVDGPGPLRLKTRWIPDIFSYNSSKNCPIFIIFFGTNINNRLGNPIKE